MEALAEMTLDTDDVLNLLTGARAGVEHLDRFGHDTGPLRGSLERVGRQYLARVDAALPDPADGEALVRADTVMAALTDLAPRRARIPGSATAEDLMAETGLTREQVEVALARLEQTERVTPTRHGTATVWSLR